MQNRNLNGSSLVFEQDAKIEFIEDGHVYIVENVDSVTSVSRVVAKFFKPFNAEFWSLKKCCGNEGMAARLRDEWSAKAQLASQAGKYLHAIIEHYINDKTQPEKQCELFYHGEHVTVRETVDVSKEWGFFENFCKEVAFNAFRTEWCVFDAELKVAGTIDLVCACDDGTYEIYDWKRSNKVDPNEGNRYASGINGLWHLSDTSYSHYCLQQNLYRYMLEKNYGLRISRMNLVVLHPDYNNYRVVPVPRMDREVQIIINELPNLQ